MHRRIVLSNPRGADHVPIPATLDTRHRADALHRRLLHSAITNNLQLAPDVRISNPTSIQPLHGYTAAAVVTLMLALDSRWGAVQPWLPQVALQALNTGPNPFGRTAMSAGILNDTVGEHEAYGQYLSWSQANWAGVVAQRAASLDLQAQGNGET